MHRPYITQELPSNKLIATYVNNSIFAHDLPGSSKDYGRVHKDRALPVRNGPKRYPYISSRFSDCKSSVPWVVEQEPAASGDNSLTALQIAKSLSEVDFSPANKKYPSGQRSLLPRHYGYDYAVASEPGYCWEKEVG